MESIQYKAWNKKIFSRIIYLFEFYSRIKLFKVGENNKNYYSTKYSNSVPFKLLETAEALEY